MAKNSLNLLVNFSEKGLSHLSSGLKNLVGLGKTGSQAFRDLKRDTRALERELAGVRRELAGASGDVSALVNRERELERAVGKANDELRKQGKLAGIDERAGAMRNRGADLRQRGRDNVLAAGALLAPFALAAKAGADFSSQMVDIQQKANLSDAATARMRNNIVDAARASAQMPDEIAASVEALAGLGMDPRQAARLALPMGRFMTAYKAQGADTAASLYAGIASLDIPLSQAQKFLDMMAEGGNQGAFEVRDMAAAMPSLTAQMKALGQTGAGAGAELVAMLQIVRRGTGTSAEAATAAGDLLNKLTAPATMKAFGKAGIDAFAAIEAGARRGVSPLETMIALTRKATGGDQKKLQNFFADKEASKAMRQLMLDYDDFGRMKKDIAGANGVTDNAFSQRMAGDQNAQMRQLGSAGAGLILAVAPVLTPALTALANAITPVATAIAEWARKNPELARTILMTVAGFGAARAVLGALQFAFGGLLGPIATVWSWWQRYRQLGTIAAAFPKLAGGVRLLGLAFRFMLGPVGLVITLLVMVGAAVYRNWDTIKAAFNTGMAWLRGLGSRMMSIGRSIISGLVSGISAAPGRVWNALRNVVGGAIANAKKLLGINSPSRVFMDFGGHVSQGMAIGIDRKRDQAFASARRLATGVAGAAVLSSPAFASGSASAPRASLAPAPMNVTMNIHQQPGEDAGELARRVRRELEAIERQRGAAGRSAYGD